MPSFGLPTYPLSEPLRKSRSMAITRLPLIVRLVARLNVIKVLPLPGLAEVSMMTFDSRSLPTTNSRLVRTTRNASLMTLRLFSLTTIAHISSFVFALRLYHLLFWKASGISPTKGAVIFSRSLRPRTTVFMFSRMKMMTIGTSSPRANATSPGYFSLSVQWVSCFRPAW